MTATLRTRNPLAVALGVARTSRTGDTPDALAARIVVALYDAGLLARGEQPSLFDAPTCAPTPSPAPSHASAPRTRARKAPFQKHSVTSIAAADAIRGVPLADARERVLAAIIVHGPVTDEMIADLTGMNPNTVRPRRVELLADGLIVEAGTALTHSGRQAARWGAA